MNVEGRVASDAISFDFSRLSDYDNVFESKNSRQMTKRCSYYLTFATCASFSLLLTTFSLLLIEYKRGTIQEIYESSLRFVMIGFQLVTIMSTAAVCAYHTEKALKRSYGFQKMENNHLAILIAGFTTFVLFIVASIVTIVYMRFVLCVGALLFILAVNSLLICVTLYKQREKMEDFVNIVLSLNRAEGLSLSEQNALDLCQLHTGNAEFRHFAQQRRYCPHVEGLRMAEYYYLQKWCAELERLKMSNAEGKCPQIDVIIREMRDRSQIFNLDDVEALRLRELSMYPRIRMPDALYYQNETNAYDTRPTANGNVIYNLHEREHLNNFY
ncbi:hypothetical protein M3Y95_00991900 [Aphelenchoides besseyi]|nr:hypothetical protein M3Y95_00991900 [Aphelenchoides besseyi]